jgi:hypothetical protein
MSGDRLSPARQEVYGHGWLYLLSWKRTKCWNEIRPGGMSIVKQQGMEVLGVELSPSMSVKDRSAVLPLSF